MGNYDFTTIYNQIDDHIEIASQILYENLTDLLVRLNGKTFISTLIDTKIYKTIIMLDNFNNAIDCKCSCGGDISKPCLHILATVYAIEDGEYLSASVISNDQIVKLIKTDRNKIEDFLFSQIDNDSFFCERVNIRFKTDNKPIKVSDFMSCIYSLASPLVSKNTEANITDYEDFFTKLQSIIKDISCATNKYHDKELLIILTNICEVICAVPLDNSIYFHDMKMQLLYSITEIIDKIVRLSLTKTQNDRMSIFNILLNFLINSKFINEIEITTDMLRSIIILLNHKTQITFINALKFLNSNNKIDLNLLDGTLENIDTNALRKVLDNN